MFYSYKLSNISSAFCSYLYQFAQIYLLTLSFSYSYDKIICIIKSNRVNVNANIT